MRYVEIDARELLWNKEALNFYNYLAEKVQDHPAGKKYLEKYFRNKILNNELELPLAKETDYTKASNKNPYIKKALDNNELYLVKFDDSHKRLFTELFDYIRTLDKNKPINIQYQEIPKKVNEYHKRFQNLKEEQEDLQGIKLIYEFKDGYKWVSINSKQGLKRESSLMQHCVGKDPQYWEKIQNGTIKILSLRDKQNKPHITIEYNLLTNKIPQIQGKQDRPPIQKYVRPYLEFLLINHKSPLKHKEKFQDREIYYGMQYQDKHLYSPYDLSDNFTWYGDLDLYDTPITKLPKGLKVSGDLNLSYTKIKELPKDLKVDGELDLHNTSIKELPEGLEISGSLDLCNTSIKELPEGLEVNGKLDLSGSQITKLPKDLKIIGSLYLYSTSIKELPERLEVNGDLDLSYTKITKLPKDLKVGGNLDLHNTQIKELPEGLKVNGDLNLSYTEIKELPKNLKVGGSLNLSNTQIKELPEGLEISGYLNLYNTQIKELPEGLEVGSYLNLYDTQITKLPKGLKVGGEIIGFKG